MKARNDARLIERYLARAIEHAKETLCDDDEMQRSLRICIGRFNTENEMLSAAQTIFECVELTNKGECNE